MTFNPNDIEAGPTPPYQSAVPPLAPVNPTPVLAIIETVTEPPQPWTVLLAWLRSEPVAVGGLVSALVALAVSFGAHLSSQQTGAITAAVVALLAVAVRSQVSPTAGGPS